MFVNNVYICMFLKFCPSLPVLNIVLALKISVSTQYGKQKVHHGKSYAANYF